MSALIVWNNGETYDGNTTYCIAVDTDEIADVTKLIELDWRGSIQATALSAEFRFEPYSLDEWLRGSVFHVCVPWDEKDRDKNTTALMQLPAALRERVAKALLDVRDTYHESHGEAVAAIVARLRT